MFIANLMASVLALAMVGASTASVSKVECNSVGSDIVLNRDIHKAYYDSGETYGSTADTFYNYTSYTILCSGSSTPNYQKAVAADATGVCDVGHDGSLTYIGIDVAGGSDAMGDFHVYDGAALVNTELDVYLNGTFIMTVEGGYEDHLGYYYIDEFTYDGSITDSYVWIFDHGTAPADPYTPVDMLGDIAEGITGGIVPVAEGIGSGLQSLVQDIFLNAAHDGLSVFGIVIICFAGLALALGLSRWVLNFVDTLGARDR